MHTLSSLIKIIGSDQVCINATPSHGLGDALFDVDAEINNNVSNTNTNINNKGKDTLCFLRPMEIDMPFESFASSILNKDKDKDKDKDAANSEDVHYFSSQDDNLRRCHPSLSSLLPPTLPLFEAAINSGPPQAINIWVGDGRARTR